MSDALASATASFEVLQRQLGDCATIVEALHASLDVQSSSLPLSTMMVGKVSLSYLVILIYFYLMSAIYLTYLMSYNTCKVNFWYIF